MDTKKIELDLINKIKTQLNKKTVVRVPFTTFVRLWQPKNDFELTKQLIRFKTDNGLDYVIIIDSVKGPQFIRFWNNSKKELKTNCLTPKPLPTIGRDALQQNK